MERQSVRLAVVVLLFDWFAIAAEATIQPSFKLLGDLPGGDFRAEVYGISADGSIVVGSSESSLGTEAFYWTRMEGIVGLGDLAWR